MYGRLKAYAIASLDSESLAEEAVQETFRVACQKPEVLYNCDNPPGWLVITLKNVIKNIKSVRATAKKVVQAYMMEQEKELSYYEDAINLKVLFEDVADLEEFKLLCELAIEKRSIAEIAQDRNITISACKKRIQRAKEFLRKKLEI